MGLVGCVSSGWATDDLWRVQDVTLFFSPEGEFAPVPSWHSVPPIMGLVCGLIVLASAVLNIVWGWRLRRAEGVYECRLAQHVVIISGVGMVADWGSADIMASVV